MVATSSASFADGVVYSSVLGGQPLRQSWMAVRSARLMTLRSVRFGRYWRREPFVFSLLPRCYGECGSQK